MVNNRPSVHRVATRHIEAGMSFKEMKSPLDYHGHRPNRLALCDSSVKERDPYQTYFKDEDPCIVAFLDWSPYGSGDNSSLYIHYMFSRMTNKGFAKKLVGEFYRRNLKKVGPDGTMDWGKLMHDAAKKLFIKMKGKHHPKIYHKGKFW